MVSAGGRSKTLVVRGIVTTGGAEDQQIFANLGVAQELLGLSNKEVLPGAEVKAIQQAVDLDKADVSDLAGKSPAFLHVVSRWGILQLQEDPGCTCRIYATSKWSRPLFV
ncbi:MAG: hypothetical protein M1379_08880 [Firmicutes bacterium]|nr:hypothetical protein [Bacillota bacterium]